ncbi:hypothetical protein P43SY_007846 [Pythium insidiosum]|uniref:Uncharacterized protein n=1 Tax=Pythium insidiosum TaxID=114742 RepID=A0AAD5MCF6_PYTIN|nr:hypothetical protein P43SY_007846 [Pythium insidiosum]
MRLASRSIERRGDRVAPDADSEGEHVALRATGSRPHARRAAPERVWLWFFLLLNLFGVCGFIFSSAFFFPSVSTTGVMKEAIDQGSVALLEIPKAPTEGPKLPPAVTVPSPLSELSRTQQTNDLVVKEHMTFFFVLAPSQVELGDTYRGQKFFGNVPYGQFLLHGGKPAFFSTTGLHELDSVLRNDEMSILVYRLHRQYIQMKLSGGSWAPQASTTGPDSPVIRISSNGALSLGNVRGGCDTNAFQGVIAEVLIYDAILPDQRVERIERHLHDKWIVGTHTPTPSDTSNIVANRDDMRTTEAQSPTPQDTPSPSITSEPSAPPASLSVADLPRTFDPEGVFEWMPSDALLAAIGRNRDPAASLQKWKAAVREKIDAVRNFEFGGPVLLQFIHERRDELLALRMQLFG